MNDVSAQRFGIHLAKRLGANSFDLVWHSFQASPEHIVFPTCVNPDDSPHSMIVWHDHHSRCPNHVEDGERIRVKEFLDFSTLRLAQSFEDRRWSGNGTGKTFTPSFLIWFLGKARAAISNKSLCLEHGDLHRTRPSKNVTKKEYSCPMTSGIGMTFCTPRNVRFTPNSGHRGE